MILGGGGVLQASASASSNPAASVLVPVVPQRVLDTRGATGAVHPLASGETYTLSLEAYVPMESTAIAANITVTDGSATSFLTVFPSGKQLPKSSNINWKDKGAVANQMTVALGSDRAIKLFNSVGRVDVIVDLQGYYIPASSGGSGPAGSPGAPGANGATGPAGANGAVGPAGSPGVPGAPGPIGLPGPTGTAGMDGPAGPAGPTGAAGSTGAAGATGADGAPGADGATGPAGADGAPGAAGATGPAGEAGPAGSTGATGSAGAAGADGAPGTAGPAGPTGATGATGPTGATGADGAAGSNGVARLGRSALVAPTDDVVDGGFNYPNPSDDSTPLNLGFTTVPNGYYLVSMSTIRNVDGSEHEAVTCWLSDGSDENGGLYPGGLPTNFTVEPDHQELLRESLSATVIHVTNGIIQIRCSRSDDGDSNTSVLITDAELNLIPFASVVTLDNL
jgi:Collagen triple helix repeat (20 copies)